MQLVALRQRGCCELDPEQPSIRREDRWSGGRRRRVRTPLQPAAARRSSPRWRSCSRRWAIYGVMAYARRAADARDRHPHGAGRGGTATCCGWWSARARAGRRRDRHRHRWRVRALAGMATCSTAQRNRSSGTPRSAAGPGTLPLAAAGCRQRPCARSRARTLPARRAIAPAPRRRAAERVVARPGFPCPEMGRPVPAPVTAFPPRPLKRLGMNFARMRLRCPQRSPEPSRARAWSTSPASRATSAGATSSSAASRWAAVALITFALSRLRAAAPVVDRAVALDRHREARARCCAR